MSGSVPLGSNLIVRSPNWLGDAIMTLPALAWLRQTIPADTKISVLSPANLMPFWKVVPGIDQVLSLPSNLWIAIGQIRSQQFSSAIIFPNSLRTGLEMFLAGVPVRIAYSGHHRKALLTQVFEKPKSYIPEHQLWHYLHLVCPALGQEVPKVPLIPKLQLSASPPSDKPFLALCPGAEYGPAKRWPVERFAEAANKLAADFNLEVVLLGGPRDEETSAQVAKLISGPVKNLTGKTSLTEFMTFLANANLVLCNDSGAMHLASLLRTKGVAIFGSTEPSLTGPLTPSVSVLRDHVPCSPCFLRECPIDFRCMNSISVGQVLQSAQNLLQGAPRPASISS